MSVDQNWLAVGESYKLFDGESWDTYIILRSEIGARYCDRCDWQVRQGCLFAKSETEEDLDLCLRCARAGLETEVDGNVLPPKPAVRSRLGKLLKRNHSV